MDLSSPPYSVVTEEHSCQVAFIVGIVVAFVLMAIWHCMLKGKFGNYENMSPIDPKTRHRIDLKQNKAARNLYGLSAANSQSFLAKADTTQNPRDNFELTDPAIAAKIKRTQNRRINEVAAAIPADATDFSAAAKGTKSKGFRSMPVSGAEDFQLTDRRLALLDTTLPQRYKWRLSRARDDEFDVYRTPASSAFV
jgi:hypothetical protein